MSTEKPFRIYLCGGIHCSAAGRGELYPDVDLTALADLLGAVLTGLARMAAAAGDPQRYVTVARFFAENVSVQAGSLEKTVTESADAVNGADAVLLG